MRTSKILLLGLCFLLALAPVAFSANEGGVYDTGRKGIRVGTPGIQFRTHEDAPTAAEAGARLAAGRMYYDTTSGMVIYNGATWDVVTVGTAGTADTVYNAGAWDVVVDAGYVNFSIASASRAMKIYANIAGATTRLLELDAFHSTATPTNGLNIITTGSSATITNAINVSDAGITNALIAGQNDLSGTNWSLTGSTGAAVFVGVTSGSGDVNVGTSKLIIAGATGKITGTAAADIDLNSVFTVDATQGNTLVAGTLDVTGAVTIVGALSSGSFATDAVVAKTATTTLTLNGTTTGGVTLQDVATGDITLTTDVVMSAGATIAADLTVSGGDITVPSATASKPVLWLENTANDATCPIIKIENDRATETDGDDLGIIKFTGSDSGDAALDFVTILAEANEVNAGDEAGKLSINLEMNDADTNFLVMFGDTTNASTGHFEINSGTVDIDTHIDTNDSADLVLIDGATNDVTLTRALAADGTNDGPILVVSNTSATGDVGVASFLNAAAASATEATVKILSSATGIVKSSLLVDHNGTAGATTEAAVRIDTDDVNTAALYVTSPVTEAGASAVYDESVAVFVAEGVGGALSLYRNVASATKAVLLVEDNSATTTGPLATFTYDGNATADDDAVTIASTDAAFDKRSLFIDHACTAGTTKVPAVEIDSEQTTSASLIVRGVQTDAGADVREDEAVLVAVQEGTGGAAYFHRNVATGVTAAVTIEEQSATGTNQALKVTSAQNATASTEAVLFQVTDGAHDTEVVEIANAGAGDALLITGVVPNILIGDAGSEDTYVGFDGSAIDAHIGVDDGNDELVLGIGVVPGTTPALSINAAQTVTIEIGMVTPVQTITTTELVSIVEGTKTFFLNAAGGFVTTLPTAASSAGVKVRFVVITAPAGGSYTIVTDSSENLIVGGINELEVDTNDDGPYQAAGDLVTFVNGVAVIGDWVELISDGAKWYLHGQANADGGITLGST